MFIQNVYTNPGVARGLTEEKPFQMAKFILSTLPLPHLKTERFP